MYNSSNQQALYNVIFTDRNGNREEEKSVPMWMVRHIMAWCDENGGEFISFTKCN